MAFTCLVSAVLALCVALALAVPGISAPERAWASELDEVRSALQASLDEAKQLADDITAAQKRLMELNAEIDTVLSTIDQKQKEYATLQDHAAELARAMYKRHEDLNILIILDESQTLTEAMKRAEMRDRVLEQYDGTLASVKQAQEDLKADYARISADKDEQGVLIEELKVKQKDLDKAISKLKKREKELDLEQKAELAQAAAAAHTVAETFKTGEVDVENSKWRSGPASAYGGSTDKSTPNPGLTATGTICDDWSVGVAVPMAWGPSKYYGKKVEISYDGRSIIAPVVDCGGMNGGQRHLDLQPGVFKAFGCSSCSDWGVREVSYRFI